MLGTVLQEQRYQNALLEYHTATIQENVCLQDMPFFFSIFSQVRPLTHRLLSLCNVNSSVFPPPRKIKCCIQLPYRRKLLYWGIQSLVQQSCLWASVCSTWAFCTGNTPDLMLHGLRCLCTNPNQEMKSHNVRSKSLKGILVQVKCAQDLPFLYMSFNFHPLSK